MDREWNDGQPIYRQLRDRVVNLSNGEYEVHNIGANWPHHIFVDTSFKVVGAD